MGWRTSYLDNLIKTAQDREREFGTQAAPKQDGEATAAAKGKGS
jgi:hypothetical protein